jgi:aminopeptidase N
VSTKHDPASKTYTITVTQRTPPTKDQAEKGPVLIPVTTGLLGRSGEELKFTVTKGRHKQRHDTEAVLLAEDATSVFELSGVAEAPVPSLLRDFSAPVNMTVEGQSDEDLVFIMANDTDKVNRRAAAAAAARAVPIGRSLSLSCPKGGCSDCAAVLLNFVAHGAQWPCHRSIGRAQQAQRPAE